MVYTRPKVGELVTVVVKHTPPKGKVFYHFQNESTFTGVVVPNSSLDDPNSFSMTTSLPDWRVFPIRNILLRSVISLHYGSGEEVKKTDKVQEVPTTIRRIVTGSKGEDHVVTFENGNWFCTCKGFSFRRNCKHINEVKKLFSE